MFANAGHPSPIHLDTKRGCAEHLMVDPSLCGPGLAIEEGAVYSTIKRRIQPGDTVFMFTDGLSEVADPNQEEYGEYRLMQSSASFLDQPLPELFSSLHKDACVFGAVDALEDDVCLVGFRLQGAQALHPAQFTD